MIGKIAKQGHSFKGAGAYYLHDKGASTSDRVLFTQTLNLATNDATLAMRCMAHTAKQAKSLKDAYNAEHGIKSGGIDATSGAVYAFSLSWHESEQPSPEHMLVTAYSAIAAMGLSEHEIVIVAHRDTQHPHVHIVANLVHPKTGRRADTYYDHVSLSAWAHGYEQEHGMFCEERPDRSVEREPEQPQQKHQDYAHELKQRVALFYECAKDFTDFKQMLEGENITLCQGDKKRLVIVDEQGKITSLTRQLPKGIGKKQVLAKFDELDVAALPQAHVVAHMRKDDAGEGGEPPPETPQQQPVAEADTPQAKPKAAQTEFVPDFTVEQRAMAAKRDYYESQAIFKATRLNGLLCAYDPKTHNNPLIQSAFNALHHHAARLIKQPVSMMHKAKLHAQALWHKLPFTGGQDIPTMQAKTRDYEQEKIKQPQQGLEV